MAFDSIANISTTIKDNLIKGKSSEVSISPITLDQFVKVRDSLEDNGN